MIPNFRRSHWAAIFLCSSFIFAGCERPEQNIGLELQPSDELLNIWQTDTTTLEVRVVDEDSLRTDELSLAVAGNYLDPIFGPVSADFYTHIRLSTDLVDFGDPKYIIVDSLILRMVYDRDYYGELLTQSWIVNEVLEPIVRDSNHYSNTTFEVDDLNLILPGYESPEIDFYTIQIEGEESFLPHLRLKLRNSLGERFVEESGGDDFANNENFVEYFKGLNIRSADPDISVMRFNLLDSDSKMTLYYRDVFNGDTTKFDFNLNAECARVNHFEYDYTGTALANVADTIEGDPRAYVQAGSGVKTRIRFPYLEDFKDFDGLTINKAELILPTDEDEQKGLPPQNMLFALTVNEDGDDVFLPDQPPSTVSANGEYNGFQAEYRFNITSFVQDLINGDAPSEDLFLVSNNASVSVRRAILHGPDAFPNEPGKNMRLVLTFSK